MYIISLDASKDDLGAVLQQHNYSIANLPKTLNITRKQYAQI